MKARVKTTGEVVDVEFIERKTHTGEQVYMTHEGVLIEESRLDFNVEPIDYWTRLEHTYAGMAMQGLLQSPHLNIMQEEPLVGMASSIAHALVKELKKKEER